MLVKLCLLKIVETSKQAQLLTLRLYLESTSNTSRHFNKKCRDSNNLCIFLQIHSIESLQSEVDLESKLREKEKCLQCQVFTNAHNMNSVSDLCSHEKKVVRKTDAVIFVSLCTSSSFYCLHNCLLSCFLCYLATVILQITLVYTHRKYHLL